MCMPQHTCRGQNTTCRSKFSPSSLHTSLPLPSILHCFIFIAGQCLVPSPRIHNSMYNLLRSHSTSQASSSVAWVCAEYITNSLTEWLERLFLEVESWRSRSQQIYYLLIELVSGFLTDVLKGSWGIKKIPCVLHRLIALTLTTVRAPTL